MEQLTVEKQGFCGRFYPCINAFDDKKAVIVVGGNEGAGMFSHGIGVLFAKRGIAALDVGFFAVPGLPKSLENVPIEPIERAVEWLLARGYERIAIYGFSKGAELSLLCASVIPEITGVIGVSPIHCIWGEQDALVSEFSYHDKGLPCMVAKIDYKRIIKNWIVEQQMKFADMYEQALEGFLEETAIPVERIQGDILLIYAMEDTVWCSAKAAEYIRERLKQHQFVHSFTELSYERASHILIPLNPPALKMFRVERKYPKECLESRLDAFERTIAWLKGW